MPSIRLTLQKPKLSTSSIGLLDWHPVLRVAVPSVCLTLRKPQLSTSVKHDIASSASCFYVSSGLVTRTQCVSANSRPYLVLQFLSLSSLIGLQAAPITITYTHKKQLLTNQDLFLHYHDCRRQSVTIFTRNITA